MQRNDSPTFVHTTSSIEIEQECCPVHISTSTKNRWFIQKSRRQEELQWKASNSEIRYDRNRKRKSPAVPRLAHSMPSMQQDSFQLCNSSPLRPTHSLLLGISEVPGTAANFKTTDGNCKTPKDSRRIVELPQHTISDGEAYALVGKCFRQQRETRWGRTLRKRLNHELDLGLNSVIKSLDAILVAADTVFFSYGLRSCVTWRWSCESDHGFTTEFVGTTTPFYSKVSTRAEIVLSKPLLQSGYYSSNLLLSAFLHELVHCYLFICCGPKAEEDGGHTPGFQKIVSLIQSWLGNPRLQLCSMRADLDNFLPNAEEREQDACCLRTIEIEASYYRSEEDPPCSDSSFSNSHVWAGNSGTHFGKLEEVVQAEFARTLEPSWMLTQAFAPAWDETSYPGWVNVTWADTSRMEYVSRQELAGAIEGSACMPIFVE